MLDYATAEDGTPRDEAASGTNAPSIAIIGMSGRFPGAANLEAFWDNLINGRDSVSHFSVQELVQAGLDPQMVGDPHYVRAKGVLEDPLAFDAPLFGFSPAEAEMIDPQQRVFLECAMAAMEDASLDPENFDGTIAIYAGQSMSSYMFSMLLNPSVKLDSFHIMITNDKDFLASRVAYKLNLRGPTVVVASACSTSLVAISTAFQSLIDYQCDAALVGGVCVTFPQKEGYMHEEGSNNSPDGYCRAFDAQSSGLVGGNGAGVIILKRLEDAIADRDHIHAVIRSCAINNDGSTKVGYTAPSVEGQAEAVALAHALGDIDPATIDYVEAHGTGTRLGDPIEVAALTKAFRRKTAKTGYCGIGSVKTNIGHLDAAAGMAGLIKTVLAMQHQTIPPTLHFEKPNPELDLADSPFYVTSKPTPWLKGARPRLAGVSSFAIGGNNAHVVLEEAPTPASSAAPERDLAVLTLCGHNAAGLQRVAAQMSAFLRRSPSLDLADAAYSLQIGRKPLKHRMAVVCRDPEGAADLLDGIAAQGLYRGQADPSGSRVVFLFPGQGAQYVGMMRGLYEAETTFRETLDQCCDLLEPHLGLDLRGILFAPNSDADAQAKLDQTQLTQPALFVVEYSLAKTWLAWGVEPAGMMGHSIGEYVAACLAGVMDLPDALRLVSRRGTLMQSLPAGGMTSVPLADHEVTPLLTAGLSLAAVLTPRLCVVAGNHDELDALKKRLSEHGVESQHIRTSHAFHSVDMEPILPAFVEAFDGVTLSAPTIPFISNLTGTWITDAQATDPSYWASQLRNMVRVRDGLVELTRPAGTICLEVGPGRSLSALTQQAAEGRKLSVIAAGRARREPNDDMSTLVGAVAKLWASGGRIDWTAFSDGGNRRKVPLPTYPFERAEYSLLPVARGPSPEEGQGRKGPVWNLLFTPNWRRAPWMPLPAAADLQASKWLVFLDLFGFGTRCVARLRELGLDVVTIGRADRSELAGSADHYVTPDDPNDFKRLFETLKSRGYAADRILHLWNVGPVAEASASPIERLEAARALGFDSLLYLIQAMGPGDAERPSLITVVSTGLAEVVGEEPIEAEKALLVGPCRVIPVEYPHMACKSIDLTLPGMFDLSSLDIDRLLTDALYVGPADVAFRGESRWVRSFEAMYFNPHGDPPPPMPSQIRPGGTFLITGGLGGIGLELAAHLAKKADAKLVLTGRSSPSPEAAAALAAIEADGTQVMVAKADVTDPVAMKAVVDKAVARFGPIHGVVHAAGVAGRGIMQLKTKDDVDRVLGPKVEGLLVLDELFAEADLDFMVVSSSIATALGAPGQAEYTSANAFLDAFVAEHRRRKTRMLSINWDRWAVVGMAVKEAANRPGAMEEPGGIEPIDGVEAFDLALDSPQSQIAVALGPFEWITRYGPPRPREPQPGHGQGGPETPQRGYNRPDIETVFEAPTNDLELAVAGLFHDILGIKEVGIDDNFFDLGGHSLLGVQLVNRIQERFSVEIGIGELFNLPSVRSLSRTIAERSVPPKAAGRRHDDGRPARGLALDPDAASQSERRPPPVLPALRRRGHLDLPRLASRPPRLRGDLPDPPAGTRQPDRRAGLHRARRSGRRARQRAGRRARPSLRDLRSQHGALIGFELARHLRRAYGRLPMMLCAAACQAPQRVSFRPPISKLGPYIMLEVLRGRYGTAMDDLFSNEALLDMALPMMRADFSMVEGYRYVDDERLDCPIVAYRGTADKTLDAKAMDAWRRQTSGVFRQHAIVGDHFFAVGAKPALLQTLSNDLAWSLS